MPAASGDVKRDCLRHFDAVDGSGKNRARIPRALACRIESAPVQALVARVTGDADRRRDARFHAGQHVSRIVGGCDTGYDTRVGVALVARILAHAVGDDATRRRRPFRLGTCKSCRPITHCGSDVPACTRRRRARDGRMRIRHRPTLLTGQSRGPALRSTVAITSCHTRKIANQVSPVRDQCLA